MNEEEDEDEVKNDIDKFLDLIRDKFVPEHRRETWTKKERKWLKTTVLRKAHVWDRPSSDNNSSSSDSLKKILKFFLSHRGETKASLVRPMEYVLRVMEMTCFLDRNAGAIPPSKDVKKSIIRGLWSCEVGVVVFSPGFFESEWCVNELVTLMWRMMHEPDFERSRAAPPQTAFRDSSESRCASRSSRRSGLTIPS